MRWLPGLFLLIAITFFSIGCRREEPLKLGFIGGLTGRSADLGIAGRDGAMLAIEQFNLAGGLNGRPVILETADDRQDPDTARKALQSLLDARCVAVIGPMTSQMAVTALPISKEAGIALLSPTVSTDQLSGLDDTFFRLYPSGREAARQLAELAYNKLQLRRIAVVWDEGNRAFTATWLTSFSEAFSRLGGQMVATLAFESGHTTFAPLVQQVGASGAEGLFLLANAVDTGLFCQSLAKSGVKLTVLISEWSSTADLAAFGGRAVDGIVCLGTLNRNDRSERFLAFCEAFRRRFGYDPGFAAVNGFDAANILLQSLQVGESPQKMLHFLKSRKTFHVLQGTLKLDAQGDVQRNLFPAIFRDGHFRALYSP
ncbi:MAG: ABC transporter substrate-binding protein [Syntrophotaleaceae bacterium]